MAEVTVQRAAQIIVDEVLKQQCAIAGRQRKAMVEASMKPKHPSLTWRARWMFINAALRALADYSET